MYLETGSLCKEHVSIALTSQLVINISKLNLKDCWFDRKIVTISDKIFMVWLNRDKTNEQPKQKNQEIFHFESENYFCNAFHPVKVSLRSI